MESIINRARDIFNRLPKRLQVWAFFALTVAKSPQLYVDRAWGASRKYFFSVIFISLLLSKCFHIYVNPRSVGVLPLLFWGPTFFVVDILLMLVACRLARSFESRICRDLAALIVVLFSLQASGFTSANIAFYAVRGTEVPWRKTSKFHRDIPSAKLVLSALGISFLLEGLTFAGAYFATPYLFKATGAVLDIWASFLPARYHGYFGDKPPANLENYEQVAIDDFDNDADSVFLLDVPQEPPRERNWSRLSRATVVTCSAIIAFLTIIRPHNLVYNFLTQSIPFAPFGGPNYRPGEESVASLPGNFSWLEGHTALDTFPSFDWLRGYNSSDGFPDWSPFPMNQTYTSTHQAQEYEHYNPLNDPLHIPNLQNDLLEPIREALHNGSVKIKHIILVKLESTRQDVWPFRSSSYIMNHIKDSYGGEIPEKIEERLSKLTPTAQRLTGQETGFENITDRPKPYGGISATNAYTSGTYTMKSITGTVCGVSAMAVEGNLEYYHDFYQPCLPHIFNALSHQPNISSDSDDWTLLPWHTQWMQSHYGTWDKQELLTPALGYQDVMDKESINDAGGKYIPEENEKETHYGHEDKVLKNYMRDLISEVKRNNTRLFLTHLTHETHTPWFKPGEYEEILGGSWIGRKKQINNYLNTVVYQDEWIADILDILEEAGIADETLLVMAGDHGISLPNDGGVTANHDAHVGNFHVPLFFSHPKIPQIEVNGPVVSTQILPTILDLLIESSSLTGESLQIVKDLLPLYEGQSMLRPLIPEQDGKREWHFSTMNPGGTWFSMRDAVHPYRLVVPLIPDAPWRFTDIIADPFELHFDEELDFLSLLRDVEARHGVNASAWLNEAAHVAYWWIPENHRRWKYEAEESNSS
ncbi:Alkaline phosphatase-like alpha/beta/alpha [Penicillium longicatenatum]|uniref:Alkaline phosphatase-like alpha/beta/alpha n=1 Tax=Penicillium longicatenatum TaxID=1561947 RepID=UPI00254952CD|nr:Alkaline phosphatase-like alpha/beta/alpha [Penicillium longicatenatum]KAJ5640104.1 Alkaline phosphatase-like alpha/beta/alpha [Penicillium longicatenatum]